MFAYDDLVQWCKDMRSAQIARRNRAWLYVQVSSGDMITRDMLSWRDEIEVP